MSQEPEIFSESVIAGRRTYFIDVKFTAQGEKYLKITESEPRKGVSFKHDRVMIFEDHIKEFAEALAKAFKFFGDKGKTSV
jgi:hypothetical protein